MANTYLTRTPTTNGSFVTNTWSFWLKRASLGGDQILWSSYVTPTNNFNIKFTSGDKFQFGYYAGIWDFQVVTNRLFKDTSAWYNIVIAQDASDSTSTDRLKIYVNGVRETSFAITNFPDLNEGSNTINATNSTTILGQSGNSSEYFDGLMSHINFVDGTAYDASYFGETDATTGEWKIKTSPSVTYGTNGFFILKDGDSVTDQSGEGNNFTVGGGTLTKTEDNPSNVFCTLNALAKNQYMNLYNGNTSSETNNGNEWATVSTTLGMNGGKYYCEAKVKNNSNKAVLGIYLASLDGGSQSALDSQRVGLNTGDGEIFVQGLWSYSPQTGLTTASNGDIYGIAFDSDNGSIQFYYNGSTYGSAVSNSVLQNETFMFAVQQLNTNFDWNFGNGYFGTTAVSSAGTNASGNGIFEYDCPTGYTALSTKGLNL